MQDDVFHETVFGAQAAGQILLFEHSFQSRPFIAAGGIRRMALSAVRLVDMASSRLLRIQAKLGIGFFGKVRFAADYDGKRKGRQQDGRYSVQMTIMFCSAAF